MNSCASSDLSGVAPQQPYTDSTLEGSSSMKSYFKIISEYYDVVEWQISYDFDFRINRKKESIAINENKLKSIFEKDITTLLILNLEHIVYEVASSSINSYDISIFNKELEKYVNSRTDMQNIKPTIDKYLKLNSNLLPYGYMRYQDTLHLDTEALKALLERNEIDKILSVKLITLIKKVNNNINENKELVLELNNILELKQVKIDNIKENKENNILVISKSPLEVLKDLDLLIGTAIYYQQQSTLVSLKNVHIEETLLDQLINVADKLKQKEYKNKHPNATIAINNTGKGIINTIKFNGKQINNSIDIIEWLKNYGLDNIPKYERSEFSAVLYNKDSKASNV